ncbi:MAG: hypothetical protein VSS75_013085 [Candidatus Parabeggiatoa sp.]|nr:hypothetical protein [Candidatus Parabeggiatoa sp.]
MPRVSKFRETKITGRDEDHRQRREHRVETSRRRSLVPAPF